MVQRSYIAPKMIVPETIKNFKNLKSFKQKIRKWKIYIYIYIYTYIYIYIYMYIYISCIVVRCIGCLVVDVYWLFYKLNVVQL